MLLVREDRLRNDSLAIGSLNPFSKIDVVKAMAMFIFAQRENKEMDFVVCYSSL